MTKVFNKKSQTLRRRTLRRTMPKSEIILWKELSRKQMHGVKFRRQYSVDQYIIDFYCPRLKLAIEVDGDSHFIGDTQEYDKERQSYIEALGIHFLRFTNMDICENINSVCQTIWERIEQIKEDILHQRIKINRKTVTNKKDAVKNSFRRAVLAFQSAFCYITPLAVTFETIL